MLWNYLCGYVIIQIEGLGLERFINRAMAAGIEIWDVAREKNGAISARVHVGGFYALHRLVQRESWSVHIRKKHGLIMRLSALRRRKVLLYGWVPALLLLLWASRMVWVIEIEGCDAVAESAVVQTLEEAGVRPGTRRRDFTLAALNEAVQASDARIAVASATVSGVVLHLEIREADMAPQPEDAAKPASIVAKREGHILSVTALRGRSLVKPGQTVQAGELLISGALEREGSDTRLLVRAKGTVVAETVYTAQAVMAEREAALQSAQARAFAQIDPKAVIIEKRSASRVLADGRVQAYVVVTAKEDIAQTLELE